MANSLHFKQDFTWRYALVFGALISATDPIAVVAIFKRLGVPTRLAVLVDGESLINAGTAIVFFTLSLALVNGAAVNTRGLAWDFVRIVGIGALSSVPILVASLVVTITRGLIVFGASSLLRRTRERMPWAWSVVLSWGGLRGGLPMVLVLSLPAVFHHRDLLVSMTFGVVILSILAHGLTMSPLLRWLKVVQGHEQRATYDFLRGKLQAARAALEELNKMVHVDFTKPEVLAGLRRDY